MKLTRIQARKLGEMLYTGRHCTVCNGDGLRYASNGGCYYCKKIANAGRYNDRNNQVLMMAWR